MKVGESSRTNVEGASEDVDGNALPPRPYGLLLTDRTGVIEVAEGTALSAILPGRDGLVGKNLAELVGDDGRELARSALSGRPGRISKKIDGTWIDIWCEPRRVPGTEVVNGAAIWAIEQAECENEASQQRTYAKAIKLLFHQTPGAFWMTDRQLRFTCVVGREKGLYGASSDALIGKTVQEFVGTDDPGEPAIARHLAALAGQSSSFRYPFRNDVFQVRIEPLADARAQIIGTVAVALNVTDQVHAETELARSRAQLSEAQALAHVGSWSWEVDANRVTWSDELYRIYGLDHGQFDGHLESFLSRVCKEDVVATRAAITGALAGRGPFAYSHRIVRPDGELRMLETRGDVITSDAGRVIRLTGSCWDVTEQWKARNELAQTASLLRATLEATADGLLVVDRSGKIAVRNQRFLSLWSIPDTVAKSQDDEALLGVVISQLEDSESFLRRVQELYRTPDADSFDVLRFKDGRVFERYSIPQKVEHEIVGRVWSFRDVTLRERLLHRAEFMADVGRLLASLDIEKALEGVAHLAVPYLGDGCAVDLLSDVGGSRRLLMISRDPTRSIRSDLPRAALAGRPFVYTLDSASYMYVPLPGRGTLFGVLTFVAARDRRYGEVDLDVAEELARRCSLAIENAQLYRGAQDALHVREEFLSIAAHEIRGPITSMHLSIQGLRQATPGSPVMRRLLDVIERDDRQLIRLVDELLDVTRIRGGRLHFDLELVNLAEITREVVTRLGPEIARSGSSVSVTTEGELVGMWDRTRLDQVVTNLASNAVKYGLGKPIEIFTRCDNAKAVLVVRDHGIGINPNMRKHIFDPFARAVSARNYGGLGLGLYIVRTIVEGLGGTVNVESERDHGSTFTVELPRAESP